MNLNRTGVSAALMPVLAMATQPISGFCRQIVAAMSGSARLISKWVRRDAQRLSAQADCLRQIEALHRRKLVLLIEKEIVAAERKVAVRSHKSVSICDARMKQINAELLSIG